jgi:DUF4097 and DUF4098 domain-containing protein YvlB
MSSGTRAGCVLLTLTLGLSACESALDRVVEETSQQTYEIEPNGTLSIRNPSGSVLISGSDDATVTLKITKKAWSAEYLKETAARISAQPNSVSIETTFPPQKTWQYSHRSGSVDYVITLPRTIKIARLEMGNGDVSIEGMNADVRADLVNGGLVARNCFGNAQFSIANGDLSLLYEKWERSAFAADARVISGKTRASFPRKSSFHLLAETTNGNVSNHFSESEQQRSERGTRLNMSFGSAPQPEINLRTTHGDIEIVASKLN